VKTCGPCTCRTSCTGLCRDILDQMPTTSNALSELLLPTSSLPAMPDLTLSDMERTTSTSTGPIRLKGFTLRETSILHSRYIERLSHREMGERFGFTEQSSWVIMHRLTKRVVKVFTLK
jgi:hypothetical protein